MACTGKCSISSAIASQVSAINDFVHLLECGNAAARRTYRQDVCELRKYLSLEGLLIEPEQNEIEIAWSEYYLGKVGQAGIVDQVSFQVMRRLGIQEAFTNDKHFEAAGFKVLF